VTFLPKSPESQAKMLAELGYAGIGYTSFAGIPEMLKQLDANDLKMFTVYVGVSLDKGKGTLPGLEDGVKALQGRDTLIWITVTSREFTPSSAVGDERAVEVIGQIADVAAKGKLRVALYPHANTYVERVEDAVRIARKAGRKNLGATFNLAHWLHEHREDNLVPLLQQAVPHLFVVTVNGAKSGGNGWKELIQPLDRGDFDNARLLATLKHLGYEGPVGLQGYGIGGDVRDNLARSMKTWRTIRQKVATGEAKPLTGNEILAQLGAYRQGASRAVFSAIGNRFLAAPPEARAQLESRLTSVLKEPDATVDSKRQVCRLLQRWGTKQSVSVLAELLADAKLSHMARNALHAKPYPEVDEALREALKQVPDDLKPGVIATIGDRGDREAVPELVQLAASRNASVARAAIKALGQIGGIRAAAALSHAETDDELSRLKTCARLRCADQMLAQGERAAAADVFGELLESNCATPVRIAALAGIARADRKRAAPLVLARLKDKDVQLRRTAIGLVTEIAGTEVTKALTDELASSDPGTRIALLAALAARGDRTAAPIVARASESGDEPVRIAALQTLCVLGDASHVELFAGTAASGGIVGEAALQSLIRLTAGGVDEAIIKHANEADPKTRVVLVRAMVDRRSPNAVPTLMKLAKNPDASVRREALRALGLLAGPTDMPDLVKFLTGATEDRDRQEAADMVLKVAKGMTDHEARRQHLVAALSEAQPAVRAHLISILGDLGDFETVKAAVKDEDTEVQDAAVRALAAWPDATPMETLQQLVRKAPRQVQQILALRGYVRMIGLPSDRSPAEDLEKYRCAMQEARRPEEKKLILNALGNVADFGALALIEEEMGDERVKAEAETAYIKAAKLVGGTRPGAVREKLQGMAASKGTTGEKARKVLDWIKRCDGHITTWLVSGPYTDPAGGLFEKPFPPEQPDAEHVVWQPASGADGPYTKHITPGAMNLGAIIGGGNRVAYLRTGVYSPEKRKALLELGSDDGVKVWINGKLVHSKVATRAVKRAEDKANVVLEKGWNILLLKIVQGNGEWGACARFANLDGSLMEGLLVRPQQQAMK